MQVESAIDVNFLHRSRFFMLFSQPEFSPTSTSEGIAVSLCHPPVCTDPPRRILSSENNILKNPLHKRQLATPSPGRAACGHLPPSSEKVLAASDEKVLEAQAVPRRKFCRFPFPSGPSAPSSFSLCPFCIELIDFPHSGRQLGLNFTKPNL